MSPREFGYDEITALLAELGRRLEVRGVRADVRLVGGAAVAITGSRRRRTQDIDASYAPAADVDAVAAAMALELDLPANWLNSSAKAWIPRGAKWIELDLDAPIDVATASPETLLAMKLSAARERDEPDIRYLAGILGLTRPEEAARIAEELYGDDDVAYTRSDREDAVIIAADAMDDRRGEEPDQH
ncbi:DUF6036 family nucleotidyltransferase [Specibacter cremeus]|uniref:DUF6036 family nucleotidyltransferase n=1 Tax=Specibacter cremeus TaxID=1629051 RepID=UPI000F7B76DA|nr:DUF6036 family nucleotidyltransferase [Specibacter cremeus]